MGNQAKHQTPKRYYSMVQDADERTADIYIFGDITSWPYLESDVSSYLLSRQIADLDVDEINVHINSYGGEVSEGWAIYNSLQNHKAKVRTICDGFACSIASVVFMAGEERIMNNISMLMIHNASGGGFGNADEHRKTADDLDAMSKRSAEAYLKYISISEAELDELLKKESWITPQEALDMGFATSIISDGSEPSPQQSVRRRICQLLTAPRRGSGDPPEQKNPAPHLEEQNLSEFLSALSKGRKE